MTKAQAYILINTKYGREKEVAHELMELEQVENVHILYGQYDLITKVSALTMDDLEKFILNNIRSMRDIESTQTLIVSDVPS